MTFQIRLVLLLYSQKKIYKVTNVFLTIILDAEFIEINKMTNISYHQGVHLY